MNLPFTDVSLKPDENITGKNINKNLLRLLENDKALIDFEIFYKELLEVAKNNI